MFVHRYTCHQPQTHTPLSGVMETLHPWSGFSPVFVAAFLHAHKRARHSDTEPSRFTYNCQDGISSRVQTLLGMHVRWRWLEGKGAAPGQVPKTRSPRPSRSPAVAHLPWPRGEGSCLPTAPDLGGWAGGPAATAGRRSEIRVSPN